MAIRRRLATTAINSARSFGRAMGCELEVEVDNQRIDTSMVPPGARDGKTWDPDLYYRGQLYYRGYANPIKPVAQRTEDVHEDDKAFLYAEDEKDEGGPEKPHRTMMSSTLYQIHMANDMISELVTPSEQWDKLFYGLILLGVLMFFNMALSVLIATGTI